MGRGLKVCCSSESRSLELGYDEHDEEGGLGREKSEL